MIYNSNTFNLKEQQKNLTEQSARGRSSSTLPAPEDSTVPPAESEDSVYTDLLHQRDESELVLGLGLGQSVSRAPAPGSSATPLDKNPEPGDLIEISRRHRLFKHWALYVGDGDVIHKTSAFGKNVKNIKKEQLSKVVGKNQYRINNYLDEQYEPRLIEDILKDAQSLVGTNHRYHLFKNNCEHFVTRLRNGKACSKQVERFRKAPGFKKLFKNK